MDPKKEKAAKRMLLAMARKNIRPQEVADRTGIAKSSISHYSNGKRIPNFENACKISEVLDVPPEYLMAAEDTNYLVVENTELQHLIREMDQHTLDRLTAYAEGLLQIWKEKNDGKEI